MKNKLVKIVSLIMALALAVGCMTAASAADLIGDANSDGALNSSDALAILQYSVGAEPENFNILVADINTDEVVNSIDALAVLQIVVGIIPDPNLPTDPDEPELKVPATKEEIVNFYNQALIDAYASEEVTVKKNTDVEVKIDQLKPEILKSIASSLISQYAKPTSETKTFKAGVSKDGTGAEAFLVPTKLEAAGAKSATFIKTENGYKLEIRLVSESCSHTGSTVYNAQASLPLTIPLDEVEKYGAKINSSKFTYSETTIIAEYDENGNIVYLGHTMPLEVEGNGKYKATFKEYDVLVKGHGMFTLDAQFTYPAAAE